MFARLAAVALLAFACSATDPTPDDRAALDGPSYDDDSGALVVYDLPAVALEWRDDSVLLERSGPTTAELLAAAAAELDAPGAVVDEGTDDGVIARRWYLRAVGAVAV